MGGGFLSSVHKASPSA